MKSLAHNQQLRNIAIIAHVDHGKTSLVDSMFKQSGTFREHEAVADRVLDSMDLERERGITIAAKNCSIIWDDVKINILDTPGHADFGGEVERALTMVDGAILLVDAAEGPLPQTRFVLRKAFERSLPIIVCLNKIDRGDARPAEVLDEIYDLFIDLDAGEEQLDFPYLYSIGRDGIAKREPEEDSSSLKPLFEMILEHVPPPSYDPEAPSQMMVANLGYSDYLGRLAIGKLVNGTLRSKDQLVRIGRDDEIVPLKASKVQVYHGIECREVAQAEPGDVVILAGAEDAEIGDTVCNRDEPKALKRLQVDDPTVSMRFSINTSPLAGLEGEIVQGRRIGDRLKKAMLHDVGLHIEETTSQDSYVVKGRGEFQLAILVETMRREGFELTVGRPQIIFKETDGVKLEPVEHLVVDCAEEFLGVVTEKLSIRKGKMANMVNHGTGRVRVEFTIPSRGLIGYRNEFLTDTKGTGILNSYLEGYEEFRGDFPSRQTGSLIADRAGDSVAYALFHLEPRGGLFIGAGEPVYEGMIIGEHNRPQDLDVNPCKGKKLTNVRASGKDDAIQLTPVTPMTLERAIEFIRDDELVEVTPKSIRLRKSGLSKHAR